MSATHPTAPGGYIPKVFISYSHETATHKEWVKRFATRLRECGVDAILDQWDLVSGEDLTMFMERNLSICDFTLLVCTPSYVQKANEGLGGVGYERMIVTGEMQRSIDQRKFIPILREAGAGAAVPVFLTTKLYCDFSRDADFEIAIDDVLRAIFKQAISVKPPIGVTPTDRLKRRASSLTGESGLTTSALRAFTVLSKKFDQDGHEWCTRADIIHLSGFGHITLNVAMDELLTNRLVKFSPDKSRYALTPDGSKLALNLGFATQHIRQ